MLAFQRRKSNLDDGYLPIGRRVYMSALLKRAGALMGRLVSVATNVLLRARYVRGPSLLSIEHSWVMEPPQAGYRYRLQGVQLGEESGKPDFFTDLVSGQRISPMVPSGLVRHRGRKGFDIKFIWDLSRFQFFSEHLTLDVEETGQLRLLMCFVRNFKRGNIPYFGPNWMCTMDVAIRAVNVLYFFEYFHQSGQTTSDDDHLIEGFLYTHFCFIHRNLENHSKVNGNHYLSNLCGLIVIGSRLDLNERDIQVVKFALTEFRSEVENQFLPDGAYFENSTGYHRLATEMVLYTLRFVLTSNERFIRQALGCWRVSATEEVTLTTSWIFTFLFPLLSKAKQFCKHTTVPDGTFVQIGDNDSGRFINRDYLCHRSFVEIFGNDGVGRSFFSVMRDIDSLFEDYGYCEEDSGASLDLHFKAVSNEGLFRVAEYGFSLSGETSAAVVRCFPQFGIITWSDNSFFMSFRCGHSDPKTSHAHEDQLSISLWDSGKWVVADKGSGTYNRSAVMRKSYREVESHFAPYFQSVSQGISSGIFDFSYNGSYVFGLEAANSAWGRWTVDGKALLRTVTLEDGEIFIRDFVAADDRTVYRHTSVEKLNLSPMSIEYGVVSELEAQS